MLRGNRYYHNGQLGMTRLLSVITAFPARALKWLALVGAHVACIASASLLPVSASLAGSSCQDAKKPIIAALDQQIAAIRKQWNATEGKGPKVMLGSCTQRLHKLDRPYYLCCKDYINWADMIEAMACLELKKFYLNKACSCSDRGGYSLDEALQDQTLEAYAAVTKLRKAATKAGIKNPVIHKYVTEAQEAVGCIQTSSIQTLRDIEKNISGLIQATP